MEVRTKNIYDMIISDVNVQKTNLFTMHCMWRKQDFKHCSYN